MGSWDIVFFGFAAGLIKWCFLNHHIESTINRNQSSLFELLRRGAGRRILSFRIRKHGIGTALKDEGAPNAAGDLGGTGGAAQEASGDDCRSVAGGAARPDADGDFGAYQRGRGAGAERHLRRRWRTRVEE